MRETYIPLFSSVVRSSLWSETGDCIKVFLTLCAIADPEGYASASIDGIRRLADLSLEDTRRHLDTLCAPDQHSKDASRDPSRDGRRIEAVPNGWRVLNLEWYRSEARKQSELARKRRWWDEHGADARRGARRTQTQTQTQTDREEDNSSSAAALAPDSLAVVRDVFAEWQRVHSHPSAKLDAKRTARIRRALQLRSPDELKQAIRGALKDDWLMGRDPKSPRKYDGLETILRDAAQIERLIELELGKGGKTGYRPATANASRQTDDGVDPWAFHDKGRK